MLPALRSFGLVALALVVGCDRPRATPVSERIAVSAPRVAVPIELPINPQTPALRSGYFDLAVPGFGEAVVYAPQGEGPRVVVVAAHGNYDRPEWQCDA